MNQSFRVALFECMGGVSSLLREWIGKFINKPTN